MKIPNWSCRQIVTKKNPRMEKNEKSKPMKMKKKKKKKKSKATWGGGKTTEKKKKGKKERQIPSGKTSYGS